MKRPGVVVDRAEQLFTYGAFLACVSAWLPIMGASRLLHRKDEVPRETGRWMRRLGRTTAGLTPLWDFSIEGTPPPDVASRAYVVVANHVSMADPFLLSSLPWDMQWVGKEELFRLPLLGWVFRLSGDIPLRRGSGESVRAMFDRCRHALRNGLSVMLFPEGTRASDGHILSFKDGAFQLAVEMRAPVLPIAIAGTERCLPKGKGVGRAKAIARVLEKIETRDLGLDDVPRVRDLARDRIGVGVEELEAKLAQEDGR